MKISGFKINNRAQIHIKLVIFLLLKNGIY